MLSDELFDYRHGVLYWKDLRVRGLSRAGQRAGTLNKGYLWVRSSLLDGPRNQPVHRIIWEMHHGQVPTGMVVDHINRDPLDNRVENLRLATKEQNSHNARGKRSKQSGLPRNVYVDWVYNGKVAYRAQVVRSGKVYRVGNLDSEEEASMVAERLRGEYHGDYKFVKESDLLKMGLEV